MLIWKFIGRRSIGKNLRLLAGIALTVSLTACGSAKNKCADMSTADGVQCDMNSSDGPGKSGSKTKLQISTRLKALAQEHVLIQLGNWKPSSAQPAVEVFYQGNIASMATVRFSDIDLSCAIKIVDTIGATADDRLIAWIPTSCNQLQAKVLPPGNVRTEARYFDSNQRISVSQLGEVVFEEDFK